VGEVYADQKALMSSCGRARVADRYLITATPVNPMSARGGQVPLGDLADIEVVPAPERNQAPKSLTAHRHYLQVEERLRPGFGLLRDRVESKQMDSTGVTIRNSWAIRPRVRNRNSGAGSGTLSMIGICCWLHVDFRSGD